VAQAALRGSNLHLRLFCRKGLRGCYSLETPGTFEGAGNWWFPPVILANLESEVRRITILTQLVQIVGCTISSKYLTAQELFEGLRW
jgi:hypothetical protein